jgi:hypothetical protein
MTSHTEQRGRLDFGAINRAGLASLPALLRRWLPEGRLVGREYTARNPTRADRRAGSFKVPSPRGAAAGVAAASGAPHSIQNGDV